MTTNNPTVSQRPRRPCRNDRPTPWAATAASRGNHGDAENVKRALDALTDASSILMEKFPSRGLERTNPVGMIFVHGIFQRKYIKAPLIKRGTILEQWLVVLVFLGKILKKRETKGIYSKSFSK